ncbi:MAG TPA: hypothetical protein VM915_17640, partial [Verrucomicrobiae bacterium]|nr:hypothetical protein [Verrucomicrobiae bacterium]
VEGLRNVRPFEAVFFDADCVLTSPNAFSAANVADVTWAAIPHTGEVTLPNGDVMPAGVTSFASADEVRAFFVMSTPSVWQAGGVRNDGLGLETMMVAVLLHEGAHVAQMDTYGARIGALAAANGFPEDFNDDSIQHRFGENTDFAASVEQETALLFQAADAPDEAMARALARQARDLMRARQARWFTGADAALAEAEDIWLTFEGSGQWVGYRWLIDPDGAGVATDVAMPHFGRRSRWWSQKEGLAFALALERIGGPAWQAQAFGGGAETLPAMLDRALAD